MIQWKKDNLPTRQEKEAAAKKQQEHEQLPDRVAEMEDALCEQDAANEKRLTDIETALCELITSASPVTTMTWPELCEKLLTRLEAQGENMSTERAEFGVLMVDCAMRGCGADPGMKGDGSNGD